MYPIVLDLNEGKRIKDAGLWREVHKNSRVVQIQILSSEAHILNESNLSMN